MRRAAQGLAILAAIAVVAVPAGAEGTNLELGKGHLLVTPPEALAEQASSNPDCRLFASGSIAGSAVEFSLWVYDRKQFPFENPEHVAKNVEASEKKNTGATQFAFATSQAVGGPYGPGGYATLCTADVPDKKSKTGELFVLCGLLEEHGYYVRVSMTPALPPADRTLLLERLRSSVRADSPGGDAKWSDAEARDRWAAAVSDPQVRKQMKPPTRSAHYIVLTNSDAGARFATLLEKVYATVHKAFPDDVSAAKRLFPILVFAKPAEYYAYYVAASGRTMEAARRTTGVALQDVYATYEGSKDDPTHLRRATLQYFRNALRLEGGGWWFRQGVQQYMLLKPSELRSGATDLARRKAFLPFAKLCAYEGHGGPEDVPVTQQAASLLAFLKEGRLGPANFQQFVRRVGALETCDVPALETIVRELYALELPAFEKAWQDYWAGG